MLLSAKMLQDVTSVNNYRAVNQIDARAGSTIDVYFQLTDRSQDRDQNPPGRRYMPKSNSTLMASLRSVYGTKQLAFPCTQPFASQDPSIWYFFISPNDGKLAPAPGGGAIIDYSNLIPLGEPFNFNQSIQDFGMVGTLALYLSLTENQGYTATATLNNVQATDMLTINSIPFVCVPSGATGTQFDQGASDAITATNLAAVINSFSALAQVTAVANSNVVTLTAIRTATITMTSTPAFVLTTPTLTPNSRITTGWVESAISIAPSNPGI